MKSKKNYTKIRCRKYFCYAEDVLSGRQVACEYVKLACKRFFTMLENPSYDFRDAKVQQVISFVSQLHHHIGIHHAGKPFILEPWQEFAVANIYGFYFSGTDDRVFKYAYIEMARKQGKTTFAAALCLYALIGSREKNAEVDLAANSMEQAKIAFSICSNFVRDSLDPIGKRIVTKRDTIEYRKTSSTLRTFSANSRKFDGFNASMFLLDEYHAARDTRMKDVLQSSQEQRDNPLGIIITTAGVDKMGPCYKYRTICTEVLQGVKQDYSLFALIYSLDEGDDWKDESVWIKSNPNLGITVRPQFLRELVQKSVNSTMEEVRVKTRYLNIWCDAEK